MGIFKKKQPAETVDVIALRDEVVELKERLAAAEQAKASLDDRLSSLAATTMVLSSATKNDTAELVDQIENLQARLATTTAVGAKVDELHQRVIDVEQRPLAAGGGTGGTTGTDPRISEQLTMLSARLEQVAELAAAPVAPDDELAARLDLLTAAAESISTMDQRVAELDAKVAEQAARTVDAPAGPDLTELDDRFASVTGQVDGRLEMLNGQLDERLAAVTARLAAAEAEARAAREHATALDAQLERAAADPDAVVAQLTPQLDQLEARVQVRVDEQVGGLHERLTAAEHDARTAREQATDVDGLRSQVAEHAMWAARMGAIASSIADLQRRVDDVAAQGSSQGSSQAAIDDLIRRIDEVAASVPTLPDTTDTDRRVGELAERVSLTAEDARVARDGAASLRERLDADTAAAENAAALAEVRSATAARLDELAARLAATEEENAALRATAAELQQRLDEVHASIPADEHVQGLVAASQASIDGRVDEIWGRIVAGEQEAEAVRAQAAALEAQLASAAGRVDELSALQSRVDELAALQPRVDELAGLQPQLDELRQLGGRVSEIDEVRGRLDELSGLASRVDELAQLGARVEQLASLEGRVAELASLESRVDELGTRGVEVDGLRQRLDEIAATVPDTTVLQAELARFAVRVESSELDAQAARDQAAQLDDRLQSVSTQLTNQLAELGREIDQLATRESTSTAEVDDAVIQSLRSGQVRLATEQARYEISFREDLATLAEQVRQLRGRS